MDMNGIVVDLTDDAPVDLSSHHASSPADSPGKENLLSPDEPLQRWGPDTIKVLQEELRNEETKLLLLRKIRLSQITKPKITAGAVVFPAADAASRGTNDQAPSRLPSAAARNAPMTNHQQNGGVRSGGDNGTGSPMRQLPLPSKSLIKSPLPGHHHQSQHGHQQGPAGQSQYQRAAPMAIGGASRAVGGIGGVGRGQREMDAMLAASAQQLQQQRAAAAAAQQEQMLKLQQQKQQQLLLQQQQAAAAQKAAEAQRAAVSAQQRQVAAKQALRKQLEQTLLQIPPPKPPPPTITLIPNGAHPEFLALVGLEECVKVADKAKRAPKGKGGKAGGEDGKAEEMAIGEDCEKVQMDLTESVPPPPVCRQCGTDHTPVWIDWTKASVPGGGEASGGGVVCERCASSNRKQALKLEHTNRLKSAFVKALQQEQAIDQGLLLAGSGGEIRSSHAGVKQGYSASVSHRGVGAEELARRMIGQRSSTVPSSQQYRSSPTNQITRSGNGSTNQSDRSGGVRGFDQRLQAGGAYRDDGRGPGGRAQRSSPAGGSGARPSPYGRS